MVIIFTHLLCVPVNLIILLCHLQKEERAKLEHKRKSMSLRKQEGENGDMEKIEKLQSAVETLQCEIVHLQELVRKTSTSIMTIIDEELHPQLFALLSG